MVHPTEVLGDFDVLPDIVYDHIPRLLARQTIASGAFQLCTRLEGIIPALEPSHAIARVGEVAQALGKDGLMILNMCGRGDKDVFSVAKALGVDM